MLPRWFDVYGRWMNNRYGIPIKRTYSKIHNSNYFVYVLPYQMVWFRERMQIPSSDKNPRPGIRKHALLKHKSRLAFFACEVHPQITHALDDDMWLTGWVVACSCLLLVGWLLFTVPLKKKEEAKPSVNFMRKVKNESIKQKRRMISSDHLHYYTISL